jgi:hypothetical protein
MSLIQKTDVYRSRNEKAEPKRRDNSVILALLCVALGLAVAGAIFTPVSIGSGMNSETWLVGP